MKSNFEIAALGKHVRQVSQRNKADTDTVVFSVTNSEGFTKSTDYFKKEVFSKDVSNYKIVRRGQFAYNPSRINVGSIDYLRQVDQALVSPLYIVFETNDKFNSDYLLRYLKSDWGNLQIRSNTEGAVRDSLKFKGLGSIKIPLPPLGDQICIAHLLGKVEGLIVQRKQHRQQLDELLKSVFLEMFGDPVRNEKGWGISSFETIIVAIRNGLSPSRSGDTKGIVYTLSAITGDSFREIYKEDNFTKVREVYFPSTSDFLVCRGNGNIKLVGKGYFYPGNKNDVMFPDTMIGVSIKLGSINKNFLEHLWKTHFIRYQIEKSARTANGTYKINQGVINSIQLILPPDSLQNQFATIVEKVEAIKSRYKQSLTDLESLYSALSQKAFKGELDLSRVPLPDAQSNIAQDLAHSPTLKVSPIPAPQAKNTPIVLPRVTDIAALSTTSGRQTAITQWLETHLDQIGNDASFSLDHFMVAVNDKLLALEPALESEIPPLGIADYDQIKESVFTALAEGKLTQKFDDKQNSLALAKNLSGQGRFS